MDREKFFDLFELLALLRTEQAVVTNFDEAGRQDVLQETGDELFDGHGFDFPLLGFAVFVFESDHAVFELEQALVADGNLENIRRQILERVLAGAYWLEVNDPLLFPGFRRDGVEEFGRGLFQGVTKFSAEDFGERALGHEKILARGQPLSVVGESAAWNDVVSVRMQDPEIARPGLQHAGDAEFAADIFGIARQFLQGRGRGAKQQIVDEALMAAGQASEIVVQSKGGHKISHRQQVAFLRVEPGLGLLVTALIAIAVFAGMIAVAIIHAIIAEIDFAAESFGTAVDNIRNGAEMAGQHAVAVLLHVGWAVLAKDVREFDPSARLRTRRMFVVALTGPP